MAIASFVPKDFVVPPTLETAEFRLRTEDRLYAATSEWVESHWPFTAVAYPGRGLPLAAWREIESEPR